MKTRKQYMNGEVSYQEYYQELAEAAGIGGFSRGFLSSVSKALEEGDEHLNTIPLYQWDNMCICDAGNPALRAACKERGEGVSLATGVCLRKAKAKAEAMELETKGN